jgi:hypothetical protein
MAQPKSNLVQPKSMTEGLKPVGPFQPGQVEPKSMDPGTRAGSSVLDRALSPQPCAAFNAPVCRKTSVLLQNLPDGFTRSMLMDVLRSQGLAKDVDFLYMPADFKSMRPYGYAFVNLSTPEAAEKGLEKLNGFSGWGMLSDSACEASWCDSCQGLEGYIERYRNSRIMHSSVDDEYKPAVFKNGFRTRFPGPTKVIRAPRVGKGSIK